MEEAKLKEHYVMANGVNLYYIEMGEGYPLIFLHGGTGTAINWENHIVELSKKYRTIAIDSRGHGKSDNPSGTLNYKAMADDIAEFIKVLDLKKPIICGLSDGGQIAFELELHYPELIKSIAVSGVLIEVTETYIEGLKKMGIMGPGEVDFKFIE